MKSDDNEADKIDEEAPLLAHARPADDGPIDFVALRKTVASQETLDAYQYLELENLPEYMVMQSVVNAMVGVLIVLGAYWFVISAGDRITPHCKPYDQPHLKIYSLKKAKLVENLCYSSTYCFWTYPIICPLALIWVNGKNLVDKRIFYECLLSRIFLLQSRTSYIRSKTFWFLICCGLLAFSSMLYMDTGQNEPLARAPYWKYKEVVFGMMAYFSAVGAFLFKLFSQWSVNSQIITLPNYARDGSHEAAIELMSKCTFVTAEEFEVAWERVEELFIKTRGEERIVPEVSTTEILALTLEQHEKWINHEPSFFEKAAKVTRFLFVPKNYWVKRLLYFEHLTDARSWHFSLCMKFYNLFMAISVVLFCWGMFYTTSHYLLFQFKDLLPEEMHRMPPPHEAPEVYERVSKLLPKVIGAVKDHAKKARLGN